MHHGFLAAPVDHDSQGWRAFVRAYELEAWGEPPALVTEGRAIGGSPTLWDVYLASDPPVRLFGIGAVMGLDVVEPGQLPLDWGRAARRPTGRAELGPHQLAPDPYRVDQALLDRMARALAPVMPHVRTPR